MITGGIPHTLIDSIQFISYQEAIRHVYKWNTPGPNRFHTSYLSQTNLSEYKCFYLLYIKRHTDKDKYLLKYNPDKQIYQKNKEPPTCTLDHKHTAGE